MAKPTRREKIIELLEGRGYTQAPCTSRKYTKLTKPMKQPYWIGKNGAVRSGRTIASSISMTDHIDWDALCAEADTAKDYNDNRGLGRLGPNLPNWS